MNSDYSIGIYLRVSNEDRDKYKKYESNSIESQRHIIHNFINKKEEFKNIKILILTKKIEYIIINI